MWDEVRQWAYSLETGEINTWSQIIYEFIKKYFTPIENTKWRQDIANLKKKDIEALSDAWPRFKRLVRNYLHNGFLECMQMEIFYDGLNEASQTATNAATAGRLLDKAYTEAKDILDRISKNHEDERRRNNTLGTSKNDTIAALQAQIATMIDLM